MHLQCRRPRFDPWVRKISWRRMPTYSSYSCLENSIDRGAWQTSDRGYSHGVTKEDASVFTPLIFWWHCWTVLSIKRWNTAKLFMNLLFCWCEIVISHVKNCDIVHEKHRLFKSFILKCICLPKGWWIYLFMKFLGLSKNIRMQFYWDYTTLHHVAVKSQHSLIFCLLCSKFWKWVNPKQIETWVLTLKPYDFLGEREQEHETKQKVWKKTK